MVERISMWRRWSVSSENNEFDQSKLVLPSHCYCIVSAATINVNTILHSCHGKNNWIKSLLKYFITRGIYFQTAFITQVISINVTTRDDNCAFIKICIYNIHHY